MDAIDRKRPNIVLVIVDSLRFDRMGSSGYRPALTPVLDRLANEGVNCVSNYSVGCPTQMAMPGVFTSSLPFDYGGYTDGIRNRPCSFVELLSGAGYATFGVTTATHSSSHCGYGRGFDDYVNLFSVQSWLKTAYITKLAEPLRDWSEGSRPDNFVAEMLTTTYGEELASGLKILDELQARMVLDRSTKYSEWRSRFAAEQDLLRRDPLAVAEKMLSLGADYHEALGEQVVGVDLIARLARRDGLRKRLNRYLFLSDDRRFYNARRVNDLIAKYLDSRPSEPFFIYAHYFDLHDAKLLFSAGTARRFMELPGDLVKAVRGRRNFHLGGLLWDIGLSYTDRHLGRLLRILESTEVSRNTILVVTGDHGLPTQHPLRENNHDLSTFFYEDWLHVPFIIHGPGVAAEEVSSLVSHLDLGPTILELADIEVPREFRGRPLSHRGAQPEEYLIAENCGRGRCDLDTKTLNICVHNKDVKVVYQVDNFVPRERDVFDLNRDPDERNNLRDTNELTDVRRECERRVFGRLGELRPRSVGAPAGYKQG